jgi:hypothetical protein
VNTFLEEIRERQKKIKAVEEAKTLAIREQEDRETEAFAPIMELWDAVKDLPASCPWLADYGLPAGDIPTIGKHLKPASSASSLEFEGATKGLRIWVEHQATRASPAFFVHAENRPEHEVSKTTFAGAREALLGYLVRYLILDR